MQNADCEAAARPKHTGHLREGPLQVVEVHEDVVVDDKVERVTIEWEVSSIGDEELPVFCIATAVTSVAEASRPTTSCPMYQLIRQRASPIASSRSSSSTLERRSTPSRSAEGRARGQLGGAFQRANIRESRL